ncbi:MAG: small ribosomal subunit Rsm22 family protein [Candidatus Sumerlaeaceae bacterium]|nr:small ribosomal subunit Rsm22 family protein [Candidatus Sumerlaeaceae bacterium]
MLSVERLHEMIEEEAQAAGLAGVRRAAQELALHYAAGAILVGFSRQHAAAYAAMRLPGTYAALARVFQEVRLPKEGDGITVLDVFAGPATAALALGAEGYRPKRVVCVERLAEMQALGERLLGRSGLGAHVEWIHRDVVHYLQEEKVEKFDVVAVAYGLGEVPETLRSVIVSQLWQRCAGVFICLEPGTPKGASVIQLVRTQLIAAGGWVEAPCPHQGSCGYDETASGWCHFSVRLGRSRVSRLVDGAAASFEDEKFSYVAVARRRHQDVSAPRVIGHPRVQKSGVELTICLPDGSVRRTIIPKRERDAYRQARKIKWGDSLDANLSTLALHGDVDKGHKRP